MSYAALTVDTGRKVVKVRSRCSKKSSSPTPHAGHQKTANRKAEQREAVVQTLLMPVCRMTLAMAPERTPYPLPPPVPVAGHPVR
jgi:hypothetical protein